jgi:hypothetical protein
MAALLLLLAIFVSQPVVFAQAATDAAAHEHHHAQTNHKADCPMAAAQPPFTASSDPCPDHAAMAHCSVTPCCFQSADGLANAEFAGVLKDQRHLLNDDRAVFSRASTPQDRPPRLV